jgi:hypothetical protein
LGDLSQGLSVPLVFLCFGFARVGAGQIGFFEFHYWRFDTGCFGVVKVNEIVIVTFTISHEQRIFFFFLSITQNKKK